MSLYFAPLFSGSSGNAVFVQYGATRLLVDAGVSGARVRRELKAIGVEPESIGAILVTHEHIDHVAGIGVLSRKYHMPVYASEGTWRAMPKKIGEIELCNARSFQPGEDFYLGDLRVTPFRTPHDSAESVGFAFEGGGARLAIATDIGCFRENWFNCVSGAHAVLLEANYDPQMLEAGSYPYELKKRIASTRGHLSNEEAGLLAAQLVRDGARQIVLGHLSQENNYPDLALLTVRDVLITSGIDPEIDVRLSVAHRDGNSGLFRIDHAFSEEESE